MRYYIYKLKYFYNETKLLFGLINLTIWAFGYNKMHVIKCG